MFPLIPLAICVSLNFFLGLIILNSFGRRFKKFTHVFETGNMVIFRGKWMNERRELNSLKGGRWKLRWRDSRFSRGPKNFTLPLLDLVRYRTRDEFSCRLLRRIRILRHPFLRMRLNIEKSYKNNNNILNGMKQMDIKNCTSDEIKDKEKEIMKFCFNKVRVFTLWIKLCSPI